MAFLQIKNATIATVLAYILGTDSDGKTRRMAVIDSEADVDDFFRAENGGGSRGVPAALAAEGMDKTNVENPLVPSSIAGLLGKGSDIASAGTITIPDDGNYFHITGTTSITDIDYTTGGRIVILVFDDALTFTHNSTTLILPTGANITTVAGDAAIVVLESGDNVRVPFYMKKNGQALASSSSIPFTAASASGPASLDYAEDTDNGSNKVTVKAPSTLSSDYTFTLPNYDLDLGSVTTHVWVPAYAITPATTSGAEAGVLETSSNKVGISYLGFDTSADEYGIIQIMFPGRWNGGTVTAKFVWMHPSTSTNFSVTWGLQGLSLADDDATDAAWGTGVVVTDEGGTTNDLYISSATAAVTLASAAAGETQFLRVYRDVDGNGTATNDDLAVDARLVGVQLAFTASSIKDA